jgi:hypothetical protein
VVLVHADGGGGQPLGALLPVLTRGWGRRMVACLLIRVVCWLAAMCAAWAPKIHEEHIRELAAQPEKNYKRIVREGIKWRVDDLKQKDYHRYSIAIERAEQAKQLKAAMMVGAALSLAAATALLCLVWPTLPAPGLCLHAVLPAGSALYSAVLHRALGAAWHSAPVSVSVSSQTAAACGSEGGAGWRKRH